MSQSEMYKLDCHGCCRTIEVPAGPTTLAERLVCPHCGAGLEIDWRCQSTGVVA